MNKIIYKVFCLLPVIIFSFAILSTQAAVVMNGSRVIMSSKSEKSVEFTNTSASPFLVQITSEDEKKPEIIAVPPIFKLEGNSGQTVRLKLTSSSLPSDRESLHYLTFTQFPSLSAEDATRNKISVILKNTVKVIFRPAGIGQLISSVEKELSFRKTENGIQITNRSPHVISIKEVKYEDKIIGSKITMLPYDKANINTVISRLPTRLSVTMLNDYGVEVNIIIGRDEK